MPVVELGSVVFMSAKPSFLLTRQPASREEALMVNSCLERGMSFLAAKILGEQVPLGICVCPKGYYLGTRAPFHLRDSYYYRSLGSIKEALQEKDWVQRMDR